MYIMSLDKLYQIFLHQGEMPDFMRYSEKVNLVPLPSIEYRDKIRGTLVSLAIGDAFGSYLDVKNQREIDYINHFLKGEKRTVTLNTTMDTEAAIIFAESLIINQGFYPEDLANRFVRYPIMAMGKTMKEFVHNYMDKQMEWYRSGVPSAGHGAVIRCAPGALISYGDFECLKLIAGMQAAVTHIDQMAIASSILQSTAIAQLLNMPPYSLKEEADRIAFLDQCAKSIKGIETKVYRTRNSGEIANLYTRVFKDLKEALQHRLEPSELEKRWGSGSYVLESVPYALYLFISNPNDYEGIFKESLMSNGAEGVASLALTLAGAYLGFNRIPKAYANKLRNLDELLVLSDRLFELSLKNKENNPYRRMRESVTEERSQGEIHRLLWGGIHFNKEGRYQEAVKYFEDLIAKSPEMKKNEKIKLHILEAYEGLGAQLINQEAYEEALKVYKKALTYDLNHPNILCDLAITYLNLDDLEKAERYARRAVELVPEYEMGREVLEAIQSLQKNQ